jgi:hypothetical protein
MRYFLLLILLSGSLRPSHANACDGVIHDDLHSEIEKLRNEIEELRKKIAADRELFAKLDDAGLTKLHGEEKDPSRRARAYSELVKRVTVGLTKTKVKELLGEPKSIDGNDHLYPPAATSYVDRTNLAFPDYFLRINYVNDVVTEMGIIKAVTPVKSIP